MSAKKNVQIIHATAPLPDIVRVAPYPVADPGMGGGKI